MNKLRLRFLTLTFITIFLSIIATNFIVNSIELDFIQDPQIHILTTALINTLIIGIITRILFNKIISKSLEKISFTMEQISKGDYSKLEEIKGLPQISDSLNKVISIGRNMTTGIKNNSNVLADNTKSLYSAVEDTTSSIENIAMSVNEIAKGSGDTSMNITELSEAISNLNNLSQDTENFAEQTRGAFHFNG